MAAEKPVLPLPVKRRILRPRTLQSILEQAALKEEETQKSLELLRIGTQDKLSSGRWSSDVEELYNHAFKLLGNGKRDRLDGALKDILNTHCSTKVLEDVLRSRSFWSSLQLTWKDYSQTLDDMVYVYRHMESVHVPKDGVQRLGKLAFHEKVLLNPEVRSRLSECLRKENQETVVHIFEFLEGFGMTSFIQEA